VRHVGRGVFDGTFAGRSLSCLSKSSFLFFRNSTSRLDEKFRFSVCVCVCVCGADWRNFDRCCVGWLVGGSTLLDSLSGVAYHGTRGEGGNVILDIAFLEWSFW
jgi:hypothetical protein